MALRRIEFDANSLLKLLTHYTMDSPNQIPLDAELKFAGVSAFMGRWVVLEAESHEWDSDQIDPATGQPPFIHVRYEGNKVLSWQNDNKQEIHQAWQDPVEAPNS